MCIYIHTFAHTYILHMLHYEHSQIIRPWCIWRPQFVSLHFFSYISIGLSVSRTLRSSFSYLSSTYSPWTKKESSVRSALSSGKFRLPKIRLVYSLFMYSCSRHFGSCLMQSAVLLVDGAFYTSYMH